MSTIPNISSYLLMFSPFKNNKNGGVSQVATVSEIGNGTMEAFPFSIPAFSRSVDRACTTRYFSFQCTPVFVIYVLYAQNVSSTRFHCFCIGRGTWKNLHLRDWERRRTSN